MKNQHDINRIVLQKIIESAVRKNIGGRGD